MDIPVYNTDGQVTDQVSVDEAALGGTPNMSLVRQAVLMYEANGRGGNAKTLTRAEVRGSGRKMRPQKHTGRARQGSRQNPLWVGGATAHGPKLRSFRQKMNRKARAAALRSAFLAKAVDGEVIAVGGLELPEPKTRAMARILKNLGAERTCLIVLAAHDAVLWRCTRNIAGAHMTTQRELNAYQMIRPRRVIFALEALKQFLGQDEPVAAEAAAPVQ